MRGRLAVGTITLVLAVQGANVSVTAEEKVCLSIDWARSSLSFPLDNNAYYRVGLGGPARELLSEAKEWPKRCPTSDGSWYAILRARELLRCDPLRTLELVEQAHRLVPGSVWIATVRARLLSTVAAAEEAVALDPKHLPAQLALASALLNEKQADRAAKVLRHISAAKLPEAKDLKARMYLLKNNARRAAIEAMAGKPVGVGADIIRIEPTAGLDWPWIDVQVEALTSAELGKEREGVQSLGDVPVGTLKELREAAAAHSKAAERLMKAMARISEDSHEQDVVRDDMAVSLARLRVFAGQTDLAAALVGANSARLTAFCTGLSELLWTLGPSQSASAAGQLRALCKSKNLNTTLLTEPIECSKP
jgi:hypothetical protein